MGSENRLGFYVSRWLRGDGKSCLLGRISAERSVMCSEEPCLQSVPGLTFPFGLWSSEGTAGNPGVQGGWHAGAQLQRREQYRQV